MPASELSLVVICESISLNDSTEISPLVFVQDLDETRLCVPLKLSGRNTYMLKFAIVCW